MKDFVSFVKNISTEEFIKFWGEMSIKIYQRQLKDFDENGLRATINFPLKIQQYGFIQRNVEVMLSAWDIPDMIYTSICRSNDYRNGHMTVDMAGYVINLYRGFENEKSKSYYLKDAPIAGVFAYIMGMTYEQFEFQNLAWTLQNFNRNYHILVASDKICRKEIIDIKAIIEEQFGFGIDELLMTELIILWLCGQHSDPLTAPESMHLLQMSFADGLYWLERDYYLNKHKGQKFLNAFGNMFEDYFQELAELYLFRNMWDKIPEGKEKSADFYIEFENVIFLFELKSGTMGIGAKQQVPEMEQIEKFYSRNIREAYEQLKASEKIYLQKGKKVIKVFLLYEFTNNPQIMMSSLPEIFEKDKDAYIFTISDLEMFFATYKYERRKFQSVINDLIKNSLTEKPKCFLHILDTNGATGNLHFVEERDYLNKILQKLSLNII